VPVEILVDENVQPGVVSLPHGFGMLHPNAQGELE